MASKKEDRSKNPHGGQLAFSDIQIDPELLARMVLSDEQHAIIGKIIVHWGQVEADVTGALMLMNGFAGSEEEAAKLDEKPLEQRLAQLSERIKSQSDANHDAEISRLTEIIQAEKWKRDAIAHGSLTFDGQANASFFLHSRKSELPFSQVIELEPVSEEARSIAREILGWCIVRREDRRGTPHHWIVENFSTSLALSR